MSDQLSLDYAPHKTVRNSDPDTARAAAHTQRVERAAHRHLILAALAGYVGGLTYTELAEVTHLEKHAVGRRLSELGNKGLIERVTFDGRPLTRLTDAGCPAHVLRITAAGLRHLRN